MCRTTIVEECLASNQRKKPSVVLIYFLGHPDRSVMAMFRSLIKQLIAALIAQSRPIEADIRDSLEDAFGEDNRRPEIDQVVNEILRPLLKSFDDVTVLLDGIDECEQHEQNLMWMWLKLILTTASLRLLISCQDDVDVGLQFQGIDRIRMDLNLNGDDINIYIEEQIAQHSQPGQLMEDKDFRLVVKDILKSTAKGM